MATAITSIQQDMKIHYMARLYRLDTVIIGGTIRRRVNPVAIGRKKMRWEYENYRVVKRFAWHPIGVGLSDDREYRWLTMVYIHQALDDTFLCVPIYCNIAFVTKESYKNYKEYRRLRRKHRGNRNQGNSIRA